MGTSSRATPGIANGLVVARRVFMVNTLKATYHHEHQTNSVDRSTSLDPRCTGRHPLDDGSQISRRNSTGRKRSCGNYFPKQRELVPPRTTTGYALWILHDSKHETALFPPTVCMTMIRTQPLKSDQKRFWQFMRGGNGRPCPPLCFSGAKTRYTLFRLQVRLKQELVSQGPSKPTQSSARLGSDRTQPRFSILDTLQDRKT